MSIIGHGIDIVEVGRIARLLDEHGERFVQRCFVEAERAYCDGRLRRRPEHYAVRFAAKEAVLKALGTGLKDGIRWTEIEITRASSGRPGIHLTGRCAEIAAESGIRGWHVSLSHTGQTAMASVIAVSGPEETSVDELS